MCPPLPLVQAAKATYIVIFLASAVLGVALRYYGEQALSSWVGVMKGVCTDGQCWGMQADYRISASLLAFFLVMTVVTAVLPVAHLGAWALKVALYILLLGLSLLIPNNFYETYSRACR